MVTSTQQRPGEVDFAAWLLRRLRISGDHVPSAVIERVVQEGAAALPVVLHLLARGLGGDDAAPDAELAAKAVSLLGVVACPEAVQRLAALLLTVQGDSELLPVASVALQSHGPLALQAALDGYFSSPDPDVQDRFVEVLVRLGVRDGRINAVLLRHLELSPETAMDDIGVYGDPALGEDLRRALAEWDTAGTTEQESVERIEALLAGYESLQDLGVVLSEAEVQRWEAEIERQDQLLNQLAGAGGLGTAPPTARDVWPTALPPTVHSGRDVGRNDPCWCGSGKKFKKCHLGVGGEST